MTIVTAPISNQYSEEIRSTTDVALLNKLATTTREYNILAQVLFNPNIEAREIMVIWDRISIAQPDYFSSPRNALHGMPVGTARLNLWKNPFTHEQASPISLSYAWSMREDIISLMAMHPHTPLELLDTIYKVAKAADNWYLILNLATNPNVSEKFLLSMAKTLPNTKTPKLS